jgi:hypothetical protein
MDKKQPGVKGSGVKRRDLWEADQREHDVGAGIVSVVAWIATAASDGLLDVRQLPPLDVCQVPPDASTPSPRSLEGPEAPSRWGWGCAG